MGSDAAQDRYDVYKDSIGEARRPLKAHVRHLFEQTTERDVVGDSTRAARDPSRQSRVAPSVSKKKAKRAR